MRTFALIVILAAAAGFTAVEPDRDPTQPTSAFPCTIVSVHDGDTVTVSPRLPLGIIIAPQRVRAAQYDCWEVDRTRRSVGPISDEEIKKGKICRDELRQLLTLPSGQFDPLALWAEDTGVWDRNGRPVFTLWVRQTGPGQPVRWIYLARWMEERGHLRTPRAAR